MWSSSSQSISSDHAVTARARACPGEQLRPEPGSGRGCSPGQALARAVTAWSDEMLCDEDDHTRVFLLGGYLGTADIVDHLTSRSGVTADSIHTPARFGLATAR